MVIFVSALGVLLTSSAGAARAHPQGVKITTLPHHRTQGDVEELDATVSRSVRCSLTVRYANGKRQQVGREQVRGHQVWWTWLVPTTAGVGKAKARVTCGGAGARTGTF